MQHKRAVWLTSAAALHAHTHVHTCTSGGALSNAVVWIPTTAAQQTPSAQLEAGSWKLHVCRAAMPQSQSQAAAAGRRQSLAADSTAAAAGAGWPAVRFVQGGRQRAGLAAALEREGSVGLSVCRSCCKRHGSLSNPCERAPAALPLRAARKALRAPVAAGARLARAKVCLASWWNHLAGSGPSTRHTPQMRAPAQRQQACWRLLEASWQGAIPSSIRRRAETPEPRNVRTSDPSRLPA